MTNSLLTAEDPDQRTIVHSVLSVANADAFHANLHSFHTITTLLADQPTKPHAAMTRLSQKKRLEFVELFDGLASSGKHTENIESDL